MILLILQKPTVLHLWKNVVLKSQKTYYNRGKQLLLRIVWSCGHILTQMFDSALIITKHKIMPKQFGWRFVRTWILLHTRQLHLNQLTNYNSIPCKQSIITYMITVSLLINFRINLFAHAVQRVEQEGIMSITKVSVNGSYIRSDGIVVLVDEDIEAYLAGTLQFYHPEDLPVTQ